MLDSARLRRSIAPDAASEAQAEETMSKYGIGLVALAALLFAAATPTTADAGKGFRYTCFAPYKFHGCYRLVGRTVTGVPIRVRPRRVWWRW